MNPQWNTPPNGDFAAYVERLSAQSALPRRAPQDGDHGLDVGMTPSPQPHGATAEASAAQRRISSNGEAAKTAPLIGGAVGKLMLGVGAVILVLLWAAQVPVGILVMLVAGVAWVVYKIRGVTLPGGVAKWQKVLEDAARKQREQQRQAK